MIHLDKRQEKTLSIPVALTNFDVWTTNAGRMSPALKRLAPTAYLFFVCLLVCVCVDVCMNVPVVVGVTKLIKTIWDCGHR